MMQQNVPSKLHVPGVRQANEKCPETWQFDSQDTVPDGLIQYRNSIKDNMESAFETIHTAY